MSPTWLCAVVACVLVSVSGERGGSSLRGALEALQRRQWGRSHGPVPDYEALYDYVPAQAYTEPDYFVDVEDVQETSRNQPSKYVIKLLDDKEVHPESNQYKIIKKKTSRAESNSKKESAFRERSYHADNERLVDLFNDRNDAEENKILERADNDEEYALLLSQLWSKYKNNHRSHNAESAPEGVVKHFNEKFVKKRYSDNWGPIAFKRKRSSGSDPGHPVVPEFEGGRKPHGDRMPFPPNYNTYSLTDEDKDDMREEYAIAFQPLDDDSFSDIPDEEMYSFENVEKRFPVSKRSSGSYDFSKKRFAQKQNKMDSKKFRNSAGTDPRIIKDLSRIFGETSDTNALIKKQVKRSSENEEHEHYKPPQILGQSNNSTHGHEHNHTEKNVNHSHHDDTNEHDHHSHLHHPGLQSKESDHPQVASEKSITVKKKSIDWSDYFGIDKRKKKSISPGNQERLRKQFFDTFNQEVIYPSNSFRQHTKVKRNFVEQKPSEETELQIDSTRAIAVKNEKRDTLKESNTNLDNIDQKLKNMEGMIVEEALHYAEGNEELDSKEEQEVKEKLLSRLAAAYSLEKMRKALQDFKQSLQLQNTMGLTPSPISTDETKVKRVAVKKEKVTENEIPYFHKEADKNEEFEEEQGAGHYLNGNTDEQLTEGYMGGSGRHRVPDLPTAVTPGSCPVLAKIVQRCHGVDLLAGDRGQLFLPLCSLHQICYLCGEAPPTTCDLVFLSEADSSCEGDMGCQRAARSALMTLRELHDNLADELDGECEASPCLSATLKMNRGWQAAFQR